MTPKPTRRPRKLILTILLTLTLLLCAFATLFLAIFRGNRPLVAWLGNTAYVFQTDVKSPEELIFASDSLYGDQTITIGTPPNTNQLSCNGKSLFNMGETIIFKWECTP